MTHINHRKNDVEKENVRYVNEVAELSKTIECVKRNQVKQCHRATTAESLLKTKKTQLRLVQSHAYRIGREMTRAVTSATDYSNQTTLLQHKLEAILNENKELKSKLSSAKQKLKYKDDKLLEFSK